MQDRETSKDRFSANAVLLGCAVALPLLDAAHLRGSKYPEPLSGTRMAVVLGVVVAIIAAGVVRRRMQLASAFGARHRWFGCFGQHHGTDFVIADGWLRVKPSPTSAWVTAELRTEIARLGEGLGWFVPVPSDDPAFDEEISIVARPAEAARAIASTPAARALLRELLRDGKYRLRIDERGLGVQLSGMPPQPPMAGALLDQLVELRPIIAKATADVPGMRRWLSPLQVLALKILAVLAAMGSAVGGFATMLEMPRERWLSLLQHGCIAGLAVSLATVPIVLWVLRRQAALARAALVAIIFVPIAITALIAGAALGINLAFDTSPVRRVESQLLGFDKDTALLAPWNGEADAVRLMLWPESHPDLVAPCNVTVMLRDGALGYERIVGVERRTP